MKDITAAELKLLRILVASVVPLRCAEVGERAWSSGSRKPQSYCWPAGRVLRALETFGLARVDREGRYQITQEGLAVALEHSGKFWE